MTSTTYQHRKNTIDDEMSPSPRTGSRIPYPSLAFASAMKIPFKASPSPPSTLSSSSSSSFSLSSSSSHSSRPMSPVSSASYASCAFPDWPRSNILTPPPSLSSSPTSSACSASSSTSSTSSTSPSMDSSCIQPVCQPNSFISDEDLLDLATLPLYNNIRIPVEMLAAPPIPRQEESYEAEAAGTRIVARQSPPSRGMTLRHSLPLEKKEIHPSREKRRRRSSPLKRRKPILGMSPIVEGEE